MNVKKCITKEIEHELFVIMFSSVIVSYFIGCFIAINDVINFDVNLYLVLNYTINIIILIIDMKRGKLYDEEKKYELYSKQYQKESRLCEYR